MQTLRTASVKLKAHAITVFKQRSNFPVHCAESGCLGEHGPVLPKVGGSCRKAVNIHQVTRALSRFPQQPWRLLRILQRGRDLSYSYGVMISLLGMMDCSVREAMLGKWIVRLLNCQLAACEHGQHGLAFYKA